MISLILRWPGRLALVLAAALMAAPAAAGETAPAAAVATVLTQATPALERIGAGDDLRRFYAARGNRPAWRQDGQWSAEAKAAMATLDAADREGLQPGFYVAPAVAGLPEPASETEAAASDVLLSAGLLRYIGDVRTGRVVPSAVDSDYAVYPKRGDAAAALAEGLGAADFESWLAAMPPDDPAYRRLRAALASYRTIAAAGDWPRLPAGPTLRTGAAGPEVAILRAQLSRLGDLPRIGGAAPPDDASARMFDAGLDFAVKRFQLRHGLTADGAVGKRTRAALAATPRERIAAITVNLERMRWFTVPASARHIVINVAAFELSAIENGKVTGKMPIIVGRPKDPTPMFLDTITAVTFMPTWTVPPRIARNEVLPKVKSDPDYLAAHDMKVYSGWGSDSCEVNPREVDWKTISPRALEHRFVQQPGPSNALGRIRFTLNNEFGIFMHDTPAKKLFDQEERAYSHGCVRVGDAPALAAFVLAGDPEWTPAAIEAAANGEETQTVPAPAPVPVEMSYLTAWVDEAGIVQFRPDIYRRDRRLAAALGGQN